MTTKISSWPTVKPAQKQKQDTWLAVVSNLHRVGRATRNPTMHPRKTYNQQQAREVYDAVKVFMTEAAELLGVSR